MGVSLGLALALLAQAAPAPAAAAPSPTVDEIVAARRTEALRAGGPILDQLVREADGAYHHVDALGRGRLILSMRARASEIPGICERETLRIEMAGAAAPAGTEPGRAPRIRSVESKRQFHLLRDPWSAPRWEVAGEALAAACARPGEGSFAWYEAKSSFEYRLSLRSLAEVGRALADPRSRLIRVRCARSRTCRLDRAYMASQISPIFSGDVLEPAYNSTCGDGGLRCQRFMILDMSICGSWDIEIESDWANEPRLRSATFVERPGGLIHCNGEDS